MRNRTHIYVRSCSAAARLKFMWECVRFSTQAEIFPFPSCVTSERAHEVRRVILLLTCKLLQEESIWLTQLNVR